jgi:prolyl oligopeptidase
MKTINLLPLGFALLSCLSAAGQGRPAASGSDSTPSPMKPPSAKVEPLVEDLHGHKITDPYRWLEDASSPETQKFVAEQNAYTAKVLDAVPGKEKLRARIEQLLTIGRVEAPKVGGNHYFYARREGRQNQPVIYVREGLEGKDRSLINVNALAPDGTIALDWWRPTHDGKLVAFGTSPNGSEVSTLQVIETATGKLLPEKIWRTRAASVAWLPDNSGFYYTKYPRPGDVPSGQEMYNRKVYFHKLGQTDNSDGLKDPLVFGEGLNPQYWPDVQISKDGKWLLVKVEHGWAMSELFLKSLADPQSKFVSVTAGKEFIYEGEILDGKLYIVTNEDAPRYRVFSVDCTNPARARWKEIVPQADAAIDVTGDNSHFVVGRRLFINYIRNAASQLKIFDLSGKPVADVPMPTLGSIFSGVSGESDGHEAFFGFFSYATPTAVYHVTLDGKIAQWASVQSDVDPSKYQVEQVWFKSKDGTRVPMFLVSKKGLVKDGRTPTLLSGYGGFNIGRTPFFDRNAMLVLLEHGGIYADVQLRGGNEFGEEWHRAGMLEHKQNVFDDFIAAAEYLVAEKYTDKEHLAIQGGSNGGLLVGAALTQRPDLFRAVVCQVPLLDMLRYQNFQIAKLWIAEYGSAEDPNQFDYIYAYSPYQHVKEETKYPAILFMTADSDTRVDPMHAKKMTALLQAQASNGPDRPILLRVDTKAGHGVGKPVGKLVEDSVDFWSFLFWQLGVKP